MDEMLKALRGLKSYIGNVLRVLNLLKGKEQFIKHAPQSLKTNYFFSFFGVIVVVLITLTLVTVRVLTHDGTITGSGIAIVAVTCFLINLIFMYRCHGYHNQRETYNGGDETI